MIRLTAVLRRHPGMSGEDFRRYWQETHAATIASTPGVTERVVRYEQHVRVDDDAGRWTGSDGYDGITVQWYRDLDDFQAMLRAPGYRDVVAPDERRLLDLDRSVYLLTSEPRIVIPGAVPDVS